MKISAVLLRVMAPVSLRSAWLMSRACRPTKLSPISPSISARGTSAATESMTMMSTALLRTSISAISSACSPVSGWLTSSSSTLTPTLLGVARVEGVLGVDEGGHAAGALRVGDDVEAERGLAARLRAEDLDDPAARHAADAERQVERHRAGRDRPRSLLAPRSPRRMIAPRPNCFSICRMAASTARARSPVSLARRSSLGPTGPRAVATGASMCFVGSFSVAPGARVSSLLVAGFAARLALWLDHLDRCRRLIRRNRGHLRRLRLRLALLLVAWSISALRHLQQILRSGAGRGVVDKPCRIGPYRSISDGLSTRAGA